MEEPEELGTLSAEMKEEATLSLHGYIKNEFIADTLQGHVITAYKVGTKGKKGDEMAESVVIKTSNKKLHSQGITITGKGKKYKVEENIVEEAKLMQKFMCCKYPSPMIKYYDFFEDNEWFYLVMENGGSDMFDFVVKCHDCIIAQDFSIREWRRHVKFMFAQMVLFISWMHNEQYCCNLDVSLENMLICDDALTEYDDGSYKLNQCNIKFIDFGLTEQFDSTMNPFYLCTKYVGKQRYKAPEVYKKEGAFQANKADIWSLGICLFMMAIGAPPFDIPTEEDIAFKYVKSGRINDLLQGWNRLNYVTANLLDLMTKMLQPDPAKRINLSDIMKHPWIKIYFPKST